MFDGIPARWEKKPERRDDREAWPVHAVLTIVTLTIGVYALKALTLAL